MELFRKKQKNNSICHKEVRKIEDHNPDFKLRLQFQVPKLVYTKSIRRCREEVCEDREKRYMKIKRRSIRIYREEVYEDKEKRYV